MQRLHRRRVAAVLVSISATLFGLEMSARLFTTAQHGHDTLAGITLLPLPRVSERHQSFLAAFSSGVSYYRFDPDLGWTVGASDEIWDGIYKSNSVGLRSAPREVSPVKPPGTTRILLVGDSFTHGDEVPFPDTWGAQLEEILGSGYEVWNGGVSGYGTDQSVLRWRQLRDIVEPDVVVLGVYRENLWRNLGELRSIKHHFTGFPLSKPRFRLRDGGVGVELTNQPVLPPEDVPAMLEALSEAEMLERDRLWEPQLYRSDWRYRSRLARLLLSTLEWREVERRRAALIGAGGEATLLTARIAKMFSDEVAASGRVPLVLLLPDADDLEAYRDSGSLPLGPFAQELERLRVPYVDAGPVLLSMLEKGESPKALFARPDGSGHPNRRANGEISRLLVPVLRCLRHTSEWERCTAAS